MNENTQVSVSNPYGSKESFEHVQRVATMFSKSDMIPKRFMNNVGNCIIALEMANRIGASPLMVMQNLDVIQGKPGWSSVFLIATLNNCGKFSPIRYEEDDEEGGRARAWAYDYSSGVTNKEKVFGAWVSMDMAQAEGWISKAGSKWKTMPQLMRRYRAASFFTKQFAPEVSMGLQTVEELVDMNIRQEASNLTLVESAIDKMLFAVQERPTQETVSELAASLSRLNVDPEQTLSILTRAQQIVDAVPLDPTAPNEAHENGQTSIPV